MAIALIDGAPLVKSIESPMGNIFHAADDPIIDNGYEIFSLGQVTTKSNPEAVAKINVRNSIVESIANPGINYVYSLLKAHQADFQRLGLDDVFLVFFNSGESAASPFVSKEKNKSPDEVVTERWVAVTSGFNRRLRDTLAEDLDIEPGTQAVLHDGHLIAYLMHEIGGHEFKYINNRHTEEYEADRRAMELMAELAYDPEYYIELTELLDKITHTPSPSHPSPKSRRAELSRTRAEILSHPKYSKRNWNGEVLPIEVENGLTRIHPIILGERRRLTQTAEDIQDRMDEYDYRSFREFWQDVLLQDYRDVMDRASAEHVDLASGNFLLTKGIFAYRALLSHLEFHEDKTHTVADLKPHRNSYNAGRAFSSSPDYIRGEDIGGRFTKQLDSKEAVDEHLAYTADSIREDFDIRSGSEVLREDYISALASNQREMLLALYQLPHVFSADRFQEDKHGDYIKVNERLESMFSGDVLDPLRKYMKSETGRVTIQKIVASSPYTHRSDYQQFMASHSDKFSHILDQDDQNVLFALDIELYQCIEDYLRAEGITVELIQFMDALSESLVNALEINTTIDDEDFRHGVIATIDSIQQELNTGNYTAQLLPDAVYEWAFPRTNQRYIQKVNSESLAKADYEGVLYQQSEVEPALDPRRMYELHYSAGTASSLSYYPLIQRVKSGLFDEEFTYFFTRENTKLSEYSFPLLQGIKGNWQEWVEAMKEIDDEEKLYAIYSELTNPKVLLPATPTFHEDEFAATSGFKNVVELSSRDKTNSYDYDGEPTRIIRKQVILSILPPELYPEDPDEWTVPDLYDVLSENIKNEEYEPLFEAVRSKGRFLKGGRFELDGLVFVLKRYDDYRTRLKAQGPLILGDLGELDDQFAVARYADLTSMNTRNYEVPIFIERRLELFRQGYIEFGEVVPGLQQALQEGWMDYEQDKAVIFDILQRAIEPSLDKLDRALSGGQKTPEEIRSMQANRYSQILKWEHKRGELWTVINFSTQLRADGLSGYDHAELVCETLTDTEKALALCNVMENEKYHETLQNHWGLETFTQIQTVFEKNTDVYLAVENFTPGLLRVLAGTSKTDPKEYWKAKKLQELYNEQDSLDYSEKDQGSLLWQYSQIFGEVALLHAPSHIRANPREATPVPIRRTESDYLVPSMHHFIDFIYENEFPIPAFTGTMPATFGFNYPRRVCSLETDILYGIAELDDDHRAVVLGQLKQMKERGLFLGQRLGKDSEGANLTNHDYADSMLLILNLPRVSSTPANEDNVYFPELLARTFTTLHKEGWQQNDLGRQQILSGLITGDVDLLSPAHTSVYERNMESKEIHEYSVKLHREFCDYVDVNGGFDQVVVRRIDEALPAHSTMRDELIAYASIVYITYGATMKTDAEKLEFMKLNLRQMSMERIVGRTAFKSTISGKKNPLHPDLIDPNGPDAEAYENYVEWRLRGDSATNEYFDYPHLRRLAYDSIASEPWLSASSFESHMVEVSFTEQLLARYLVLTEAELVIAVENHDYVGAFSALYAQLDDLGNRDDLFEIPCGVIDRYKEWIILRAFKDKAIQSESDLFSMWDIFKTLYKKNREDSPLPAMFLERYIEIAERDRDAKLREFGYFDNIQVARESIIFFMPEGSYKRNDFIEDLAVKGSPIQIELDELEAMLVTRTGRNSEEDLIYTRRVSLRETIMGLSYDAKVDTLIYFLDENALKPEANLVRRYEEQSRADFSTVRETYWQLSELEKLQYVQRLLYGPDGFLSREAYDRQTKDFGRDHADSKRLEYADRLVTTLMSRCEDHPQYETYKRAAIAATAGLDPLDVAEVVAKISHKMTVHHNEALALEDLVLITSRFFSSIGVKLVQFEVDSPINKNEEFKAALSENKFNAGTVTPFSVSRTFKREQQSGFYEGHEIVQFIRPLGKGGVNESYLILMKFPDGEIKPVAWKQVAEDVRHPDSIDRHLRKVQVAAEIVQNEVTELNLAGQYLSVLRRAILKETDVESVVSFQRKYREYQNGLQDRYRVPEVGDHGAYSYLEEYIVGDVVTKMPRGKGTGEYSPNKRRQSLQRMIRDRKFGLVNDDPHDGNRFIDPNNPDAEVLLDYGMHSDYTDDPGLREASWNISKGVMVKSESLLRKGLTTLGVELPGNTNLGGNDMFNFLVILTDVFKSEQDSERAGVIFDTLWWLYRVYAEYERLDRTEKIKFATWILIQ